MALVLWGICCTCFSKKVSTLSIQDHWIELHFFFKTLDRMGTVQLSWRSNQQLRLISNPVLKKVGTVTVALTTNMHKPFGSA